jgi:DNA-directed RNA polymerase III subunit RPC2
VNKVTPVLTPEHAGMGIRAEELEWTEKPEKYSNSISSSVDRVILTSNSEHQLIVKNILRQVRRPELGDKFSSRHGQKGVCGLIVP